MASITATVFIENIIRNQDGVAFAIDTAEPHRRRRESGEWETTARTFRTVKASRDSGIQLDAWQKGDRVTITGSEKTEVRAGTDRKHYTLVVWADSIVRAGEPHRVDVPPTDDTPPEDPWATAPTWSTVEVPNDETPF